MKYDTTVAGTRNEWKSLGVMVCALLLAAGGIRLAVYLAGVMHWGSGGGNGVAVVHAKGFVNRMSETNALVRGGDTYVNIYARGNEMSVHRAAAPNQGEVSENWYFARSLLRIVNNPEMAKVYGVSGEVEAIKALNIQVPGLTPGQQSELGGMFLETEDLTGVERREADQALIDAVAQVRIGAEEEAAFDAAMERVKTILTPAQVEYIRSGRRPVVTAASRPGN